MTPTEIESSLLSPSVAKEHAFQILQSLGRLLGEEPDDPVVLSLLIRALEYREAFEAYSPLLNALLRADPRTCDSSTRGWRCQTPEHDADHGETDEGDNGSGITLEVAGEAPVAADPGERSLHDPAFRQGHEAVRVGALNDFQLPAAGRGDGRRHPRPLVAAVGEDGLDEGERTARGSKQLAGAVAILHVGGMDDDAQQQAECIDEDVALAPRDLLARIEALRVERSPPFCAPLALWLSITAADGLASRPSRSRTAT